MEDIKDILDEVMDGETYALWLKNRVAFYGYDLEHLVSQLHADEEKFVALSWNIHDMMVRSANENIPWCG